MKKNILLITLLFGGLILSSCGGGKSDSTKSSSETQSATSSTDTSSTSSTTQHAHSFGSYIDEVPATFIATGIKGHYHCSGCNKDYELVDDQYVELDSLEIAIPHINQTYYFKEIIVTDNNATDKDWIDVKESFGIPLATSKEETIELLKKYFAQPDYTNISYSFTENKVNCHYVNPDDPSEIYDIEENYTAYEWILSFHSMFIDFNFFDNDTIFIYFGSTSESPIIIKYLYNKNAQHVHQFDPNDWFIYDPASCTTKGTDYILCDICGGVCKTRESDPLGHEYHPITGICTQCDKSLGKSLNKYTTIPLNNQKAYFNFTIYEPSVFGFNSSSQNIIPSQIESLVIYKDGDFDNPIPLVTNIDSSTDPYFTCETQNTLLEDTKYYGVITFDSSVTSNPIFTPSGFIRHKLVINWSGNDNGSCSDDITLNATDNYGNVPSNITYNVYGKSETSTIKPTTDGVYMMNVGYLQTDAVEAGTGHHLFFISNGSPTYMGWATDEDKFVFNVGDPIDIEARSNHGEIIYEYKLLYEDDTKYTSTVPNADGSYIVRAKVNASEGIDACSIAHTLKIICNNHDLNEYGVCKNGKEYYGEVFNIGGEEKSLNININGKSYYCFNGAVGELYYGYLMKSNGTFYDSGMYRFDIYHEDGTWADTFTDSHFSYVPEGNEKVYITITNVSDNSGKDARFAIGSTVLSHELTVGVTGSTTSYAKNRLICFSIDLLQEEEYLIAPTGCTITGYNVLYICDEQQSVIASGNINVFTPDITGTHFIFALTSTAGIQTINISVN